MLKAQPKPQDIERGWFLVDAADQTLGRLSSKLAKILQGKHRPYYTPHWDMGDHVVVINAERVRLTGRKEEQKVYYRHSGYPGGLKQENVAKLREKKPEELIMRGVRGMRPKNRLRKEMRKTLHVMSGAKHPHEAQQPQELEI